MMPHSESGAAHCAGVAHGAESVGQQITSGPRRVQSVLASLQKRIEEQRIAKALKVRPVLAASCAGGLHGAQVRSLSRLHYAACQK